MFGTVVVSLAVIGGYVVWSLHRNSSNKNTVYASASIASPSDTSAIPLNSAQTVDSIPLNGQPTASDTSGGLTVTNDPGSASSSLQNQTMQGQANAPATTNTNTSSSSTEPNPDTFKQYNQYTSAKNALFGDMKVGTGVTADSGKKIILSYKGWLTNGQLFDESKPDLPFSFTMGKHEVISGMEEGVYGMKVGGTRLLIIPPSVGYGAAGHDPIPGNAVLVFVVQLINVQ